MELWQYYRILRKRKWLIVIGTLICVGIVMLANHFTPQMWEAWTTVMEKMPGDDKVSIYNAPYAIQMDPKMRLSNLGQLVKSQTVMQRSVETLYRLGIVAKPESVVGTLDVTPVLDTVMLRIIVRSDTQAESEATANVVTAEFVKFYNEMNYGGTTHTKQFIKRELPKVEKRLTEAREASRKYKEDTGAVMLTQQTSTLIQKLAQLETQLSQYQVQSVQARGKAESLGKKLADQKQFPALRDAQTTVASNPVWQSLRIELSKQEIEMQKMLRDRKPAHPEVMALQNAIDENKKKLVEAGETALSSTVTANNPVYDSLIQNYVTAAAEATAAQMARVAAEGEIAIVKPKLQELPAEESKLAQLTLDEDAAKNTYTLLRQKLDEATIREQEAANVTSIQVVDQARSGPADPRKTLKLILAFLLAPVLCAGIAFLMNYLDNTVKTPEEAEALLNMPVFAVVPMARSHSLSDRKHVSAVIGSSYQMLSTNLWISHAEMQGHTILVASAEPDVGRSTTAANLAISLARDGARVILVDSDLRQPSQHEFFEVVNEKGLSNILAGQLALKDALQPTSVTDLLLIPSGPLPANPVRMFRSPEMARFVKEINELADFVIFDSPSGAAFADATLLAVLVKNVIIVHAAGSVPRGAEAEFNARLAQIDSNLLGAVLNMVKPEDSHGYYHFKAAYEETTGNGKHAGALPLGRISEVTDDSPKQEVGAGNDQA